MVHAFEEAKGNELPAGIPSWAARHTIGNTLENIVENKRPAGVPTLALNTWPVFYRDLDDERSQRAIDRLRQEGRVSEQREDGSVRYVSARFDVPVGSEGGWEAAVLDHFQTLVAAVV